MISSDMVLTGKHVRLEPLRREHVDGLIKAAKADSSLYKWTYAPLGADSAARYIETALALKAAGTAVPFCIFRVADGAIIGSTRFWNMMWWAWPAGHEWHGRQTPDVCEIGHTWLTRSAIRTAANTEMKLLMLGHAFDEWRVHRVSLHTDERNESSRAAITRLGAKFEGILRAHRIAGDATPRNSARFSILASEWPEVKARLEGFLKR